MSSAVAASAEAGAVSVLERRRFLKVVARLASGTSFGSGYLVAPGLALSAAHVVEGAVSLTVRSPGSEWTDAELVWAGRVGEGEPDLALLRVDLPALPPVPLGRLDSRTVSFTAVGYPLAQSSATGQVQLRDSEQVVGFLTPLTGLESGLITLHATSTAPERLADGRSPWAGMSGAAVLVDDRVVGVVVHDPGAFGPDRLVAQPLVALWTVPGAEAARAALAAAGISGPPTELPPTPLVTPAGGAPGDGSGERVVGERISTAVAVFTDRVELRARLRRAILDGETPLIAVFGRRGIGKSGLVAKVMADLEEDTAVALDGVCYLSTRTGNNRLDLARILGAAARLLPPAQRRDAEGVIESAGHTPGERCAYVLRALAGRRWVLVLDDLDPLQDRTGEIRDPDVSAFLEAVARAPHRPTVVLTSRTPPIPPPALLALPMLPLEMEEGIPAVEGADLLVRLDGLGLARMKSLSAEERQKLVDAVHGIPRALELLVGMRARAPLLPPDRLVRMLHSTPAVLDELVATTYSELGPRQLATVRVVAAVGTPIAPEAVVQICEWLEPEGRDFLDVLSDLVATRVVGLDPASGEVRLHPLDSEAVLGGLPSSGAWSLASLSHVIADWYRASSRPATEWHTRADVQSPLAEARHRIRAGEATRAVEILLTLARLVPHLGEAPGVRVLLERAAPILQDERDRARHALALTHLRHYLGPNSEAIPAAEDAQRGFGLLGEPLLQAEALSMEGDVLRYLGRFDDAVDRGRQAVGLLEAASATPFSPQIAEQLALMLLRLGLAELYAQQPQGAAETARRLAELAGDDPQSPFLALEADLVSLAHLVSGAPSDALAVADEGVRLYARGRLQPENATYVLNVAGLARLQLGDAAGACQALTSGLQMAIEMRLPRAEGFNAFNLTWALVLTGRAVEAGDAATRAVHALLEDGGQEMSVARALQSCLAALRRGETEEALRLLEDVTELSAPNPELYVPTPEALKSIKALIRSASEAALATR